MMVYVQGQLIQRKTEKHRSCKINNILIILDTELINEVANSMLLNNTASETSVAFNL